MSALTMCAPKAKQRHDYQPVIATTAWNEHSLCTLATQTALGGRAYVSDEQSVSSNRKRRMLTLLFHNCMQTIKASGGTIAATQVGSALRDILDNKFQAGSAIMCIARGNWPMRFQMGDAVGDPLLHFTT